jgi:hypothetical protein
MKEIRADKRRYHYIYKITRFDCKYYIGMHSTNNLDDGYFGSGKLITRSIKKHGIEKHTKEILEFLGTRDLLKLRERELVDEEIINDPLCMNLQLGGGGGFISQEHREKFFAAAKLTGTVNLKKIRKETSYERGKEIAVKIIESRRKSGKPMNGGGRPHSASAKKKISEANSISQAGEKNSQFGSCWVIKDVKPIKIKKEQLDEYLLNGYRRGRKSIIAV